MHCLIDHDRVGNYTLPLDQSVLVLSGRCQLGCHGESWTCVWRTRLQQTSRAPVELSNWPAKCGASRDATL